MHHILGLDVSEATGYKGLTERREAKTAPEEKVRSPERRFLARTSGTHAEHAATMAKVLWACEIRVVVGEDPAPVAGMNHRYPDRRRGQSHNPPMHAW